MVRRVLSYTQSLRTPPFLPRQLHLIVTARGGGQSGYALSACRCVSSGTERLRPERQQCASLLPLVSFESLRLSLWPTAVVAEIDGETASSGPLVVVFMNVLVFQYSPMFGLKSHAGTFAARALSVVRRARVYVRCS